MTRSLVFLLCIVVACAAQADSVDDVVAAEMQKNGITGLSLAIIEQSKIIKAQGYGFTATNGKTPVTTSTLFQAGSISKPVAALGALHLVEQDHLSLDADVNTKLQTWKVPENEFTKDEKVTLRRLLSHTAGLTVHGFPGYAVDARVPTLVQVLNGDCSTQCSRSAWRKVRRQPIQRNCESACNGSMFHRLRHRLRR